jgi:hypothetical protein
MRLLALVSALALIGGVFGACDRRECPAPGVVLPASPQSIGWEDGGYAIVGGEMDDHPVALLLNTGFPQTAVAPARADAGFDFNPINLKVEMGGATADSVYAAILIATPLPMDGLVGAEVLHQIPISFDARARSTTVFPGFSPRTADTAFVQMVISLACRNQSSAAPQGPFAMLVRGEVEGMPMYWEIDTGSEASLIRSELLSQLTDRAQLTDLAVRSGFLGGFFGTATRAREIKAGQGVSPNALVIAAPEIDALLDERSALYTREAGTRTRGVKVDGLLGWSFMREFQVALTTGESAAQNRGLGLVRFDTQTHWTREFVGIGIYRAASQDPAGIRVIDFLSHSPAQEAGLVPGDVIVKVDGLPVSGEDAINSQDAVVDIEVLRRSDGTGADGGVEVPDGGFVMADGGVMAPITFQVRYEDLLPNPP